MKSSDYWAERCRQENRKLYDRTYADMIRQMRKAYKVTLNGIRRDLLALYQTLMDEAEDGEIRPNDLYRFRRYYDMQRNTNRLLRELGGKERSVMDSGLIRMYEFVCDAISEYLPHALAVGYSKPSEAQIRAVCNAAWCADGKNYSSRIWDNKELLQKRLDKGLLNCVSRGLSKDEAVKDIMQHMGKQFYIADNLVRTELAHVQTEATAERLTAAGVHRYKFLAEIDDRTSEICKELNGQTFEMSERKVGVNCPPMHPGCRSDIVAVITPAEVQAQMQAKLDELRAEKSRR
ncbi:minor capsid protein [Butyricicoccus sp.]|uniref:minor capsid protein n=1 Tax=Butyricicoccus sp. TaxID=2049021 RepID=UPI003F16316C